MVTRFVLGSVVSGGSLVFAMPLAFASLLSLRYPDARTAAMNRGQNEGAGEKTLAEPSNSSVVGPERLESLRAARTLKSAPSSPGVLQAA